MDINITIPKILKIPPSWSHLVHRGGECFGPYGAPRSCGERFRYDATGVNPKNLG